MKSVFAVSMHKAGSTILDQILTKVMQARGLEIDRISLQVPSSPLSEGEVFVGYQERMKPENVYYGVARGIYVSQMTVLPRLKVIVQVRDPRDCITSAYFSFKLSHVPPKDPAKLAEFNRRRERLQAMDIDEYAQSQVGSYRNRMNVLRDLIGSADDVLVLKYEDMVLDTERWLGKISEFVEQPITDELRAALGDKIDFRVSTEDPTKHKRQVTPGDHKRKLAPETIKAMTARLREQLDYFGYGD